MSYNPALKPDDIPHLFAQAWNDYNPDGIANLFLEDADFVNVIRQIFGKLTTSG